MTSTVYLYTDRAPKNLNLNEIATYLKGHGFEVKNGGDFLQHFNLDKRAFGEGLARIRIKDIRRRGVLNSNPSPEDIATEVGILNGDEPVELDRDLTNVYEGLEFSDLFKEPLKGDFHILFTSRMLATWSDRYHGRTIVINPPLSIISTTGIVEAPIKPPEYYAKLLSHQRALEIGFPLPRLEEFEKELKEEFKGRFIDYGDERLTEVAKGLAMQALVYFLTSDAFCDDSRCRLFNAHTQEDLIKSQLEGEEFCDGHGAMLKEIKNRNLQ
ncbi:MAG: DUF6775 family putative metallopeptidase [Candidatus Hydrothermarchaeales archaeon]